MIKFIIGAIVGGIITAFAMCLLIATDEGDCDEEE
jgi:gas vesicle protein